MRPRFSIWFESLSSPQNFATFGQALLLIAAVAVLWVFCAIVLSFLGGPLVILLTIALVSVFIVKSRAITRRQQWANEGRCANCGYDLRATPSRCPECGRDATLDEPAWRRLRRSREIALQFPREPGEVIPLPAIQPENDIS